MFSRLAWLFGLRKTPLTPQSLASTMERAATALENGDSLRAEELVHRAAEQAAAEAGQQSRLYALALFNEATILSGIGDLARAAQAFRSAAEVPAAEREAQQNRLTYLTRLGEILTRLEQLEEAEQVLREGLSERQSFYGLEHSGYATGLAPLAENLLAQGRLAEAEPLIEQAVLINWEAGHEAVAGDMAIRAYVLKAAHGPEISALDHWEKLPPHMQEMLAANCLERAERADPHAAQAVLLELRRRLQATPDVEVLPLASVNTRLASIARLTGDHDVRIEACRMAIKLGGGMDDSERVVSAWEGLAMALEDAGRGDEAAAAHRAAAERARRANRRRTGFAADS
jgi:tetratricopeptide (TPR) repeat protein